MTNINYKLTKVQENLLNIENLREVKEINNICASLEIPAKYTTDEILFSLNIMLRKIDHLRIEVLSNKEQYIRSYQEFNNILIKKFESVSELDSFIEVWKKDSIFDFKKPLHEFLIVEINGVKKQLLIKFHHLISDIQFITQFSNTFVGLLLNDINIEEVSGSYSQKTILNQEETIEFWEKELESFEGENLYKENSKNLGTEVIKEIIPQELIRKFEESKISKDTTLFDFILAGVIFSKKVKTFTSGASVGLAVTQNDGWNSNTSLLPIIPKIDLETSIKKYILDVSEKKAIIKKFCDYTISEMIENNGIESFESLTDISCMEMNYELKHRYLKLGFKFKVIGSGSRTNPLTIMINYMNEKPFILYEYQTFSIKLPELQRLHLFIMYILEQFIDNIDKKLASVPLLKKQEEVYFEKHVKDFNKSETITGLFKKQVEKFPNKIAVRYNKEGVTFKELDKKCSELANLLINKGVCSGQVIASTLVGIDAIVAIFAILKVGGIYLPVDKENPFERIKYILSDSLCKLLITSDEELSNSLKINTIIYDSLLVEKNTNLNSFPNITSDNLAYIIYTSGSTGVPKGVMIKHSSVINMCEALINDIGIEENDIIQQFASHSFDASILEIFGALLNGCTLVMVNHEEKQNPNLLQDMWDTEKVTFAIIPPVYMQNLDTKRETTLKYLMTAGEEANWNFILEWKDKVKYFNAYGPTEATVWTSTWEYRNFDTNLSVPIGRPIQNVSCHVFQGIQECGLEIPGELYISGDSLSVGYINNDSKNEKSFLLHPRTKEKMYRTGDIVYWNSEKELVFCGRKDNQVKVRGHRIDLSELNSIILKQNEVKEVYSCITNLNSKNSEKEVVVYVVLQNPIDKNTFRKKIIDQLPTYMQPHHIIEIAKLPMTLNGKVDKKSLPSIIRESKVSLLDTIDNSTKKDIIEVFEEILKITIENENIDFYSLGGDSIKAIRIVSKLKNRGYKLRTNDIVDSKSIDEIILRLGNTNEEKLISQPFESDIILSPIQKEFFRKDFFVKEHFNQCETLYINSSLNDLEIKSIFKELTENHILFKVNFDQNNQPFINRGRELFLFESHDFKDLNSDEFNIKFKLICEKNQNKFDLENSPLINIVLFKSSTGSYIFITIHHLIIDGVSWRLLNDELNTIFTKRIENREIDLPRENITFFEWARKLDKYQTRILKEEKSYWDKINNDLEKINSSKTKLSINNINSKKITIDMDDSLFLTGNSKHAYRINDIFLAALIKAVNSDTLALMLESHGRESIEQNIENDSMIGWFTSIYPVIFENKKDFDDLLASVSCITKRIPNRGLNYLAYKDQKISNYEKVFEPLIVFNYLGDFQENLEHIKLVHLDMGDRNSKSNHLWFPLTITGQSINNNLFFEFKFEQSYFSISEIEKIAERFKNNIHTIIEKINSQDCMAKYGDCSWSKEELQSTIETTKINGLEIEKIYPLSYMQENFLFNKMLDKQDKYIVQVVMNVYKELKEEKIYSVMEKMASRFEILRTAIFYKQQKVARNVQFVERNIPVTFEDFDGFDSQTIDKQIKKYIAKEKKSSWDFEKDPLFRVHVINIGENQSKLIWSFHHIIMDGWCLDIINNLFIQLYEEIDYQENQKISEYSDFVELLDSNNEIKTKYFWENYLENFEGLPILLPEKDNSYKKIKKSDLDEVGIKLTLELTELIQNLGKKIKVGVGTILESAWGIVLQAYSASNDVVFGKIISGRDVQLPGIDNMVGLFINTIPIRIKTDPNLSVSQLLKYQQRKNYLVNGNEMISLSEINNLIDQKISSLFSFDVFNDSHPEWMKHEKTFEQTDYTLNLSIIQEEKLYIKMISCEEQEIENVFSSLVKPFDLENDSLIRMNILRTTKNDYVFIDIHHSINDGYSTSLFTSELMKKYRGEQTLPVLMPSAELNDLLNNENLDSSDNYWKETFSQKPTLLDLPLDFPRVSRGNESGDEILIEIDKNLKKNIDNFCSSNSITLYMFFASLTMYYLSILTNQRDIIIGTAINSRLFEKSENTFGMYTNTLPLRGTINQDDDFATIIQKTKKVVLKLFENQLYPLDRIIKLHNSNTDYTRNPLFDVFLAFNKVKTLEDGFLKQIPIKSKTSPFDITIDILEIDSTLTIRWEFKKAIFRKETIERLSNEYLTLLMESINTPIVKSEKTEQIKAVIEGVLNNKVIFSESFLEQGGDSIKAIRISSKLAEKSIILDSDKILGCNNLYELLQDSQSIENSKDNSDLIYILKSELNEKDLDLEKDFLSQGGDSIKAIRIASKFKEIGFKVEPEEILQSISLKKLFHTKNEIGIIENNSDDNILISPIIEEFFSQNLKNPNFFNQSVLLELKFEDKYEDIIKIFDRLTEEHSIFKENFSDSKISSNRFIEVKRPSYKIDFIECTDKEFIKNCKSYCNNAQNKFDISSTPLLSLVYFKTEKRVLLFICAHHLVIDGVSWRILLDDFIYLQNQLNQNKELTLPYKTMDYKSWLNELQKHGDSEEVTGELSYWNNVVSKISEGKIQLEEPRDKQLEGNPFKKIKISISEDETKSLQKLCNPRDDIQINDLLLTALAFAMNSITNQKLLSLNLEGHGRESINNISKVDRTIGWFTTNYPLILDCSDKDIWDLLNKTKAAIRRIPKKGFNFGILKYCKRILNSNEMSECSFNFMGNIDNNSSSLVMSDYDFGNSMDENNTLWSPLNFNGIIQNKCLKFIIDFNSNKFKKSDIEELGKKFKEAILSFINNNDRGELLPLTPSQEGILFQKLTNDNPNLYSTQTLFEILGNNLDLESLKLALSKLSTKHPALSMRIVESDSGSYLQKVDEIKDISVTEFDYSNSTIDLNEILTKVKSIEMNKDFYLEKGNLFRAIIIKANDQKTYLLLSFHHIVFDGWSLANLLKTLSITYKYYVDNEYVKLDRYLSKKDNYQKYLKFIGGIEDNNGKEYWVNLLGDYDGESDFKNLETNVHNRSLSGNLRHNVPKYVYDKLTHLSSKLSVTRNTILEVVWGLLIQRFNYTSDSVFGKVVSGRNFEIENIGSIVGMLINTIPTRISVENNETIKELILKNKQQLIQGQHYQYVSPSEIQKLLGRRTPLFSTVYSYSNFVSDNQLFEFVNGITLQVCEGVENPSYDISCMIHDTGDYMSFQLSFNIEKFSDDTINNLLQTMENILEYICFYPEHKVKDIQVLNQEQLRKLYLKNQENQKEICLANIPEAISQNAIHNPEKTAIFYLDEKISFKELESKSNALANILLQNGIKTEDRVGIYLSKSPMVIISMLAVMKAGACCVTMDKSLPFERVSFQLEDAGVKILFTDDEKSGNLQNIKIIQPDQCNLKMNSEKPRVVLDKNNVAYVLYTSGSTGTPKGSLIEYQGLMNLFDYIGEKFQLKNNARILQFASLSFDASVLEIFGALVNNSQLVIVPDNIRNSPEDIKNLINEMQVTFALIPPVLMPFFKPDELNTLKYIMNAGDEASPEIAKVWSQKMCYINGYGPSEASIWTTDWTIYKLQDELKKCPIGKPIQNVNVHIMNNGVLVGDYMPGELCISGISLSRGYLNRDELNKQVFFEDRLISKSRIYRTGDLVRRLPNGNIEYLGRIDRQVKIRGFRIELGEIESQILNISSIKQAACCIVSENNDKHIVAYIVSDNNILSAEVKLILQKKLPYYMIPERIVSIDSLPTTINGKVDRKTLENFGLPKIENLAEDLKMSFREREFCEVLEKILKIDISNVLQPLSNIISDSITAMRIVAKLNKLGYMISLKDILSKKSIRDLHLENSIATIPEEITEKKITQKNERRLSKPYSITYKQDFKSKNKYSIYKATKMQQWIKKQPMIVSGAIFDIEGDYDYTDIINSLKKVVKENGVLRSSYVYIDNVLNIKEYPFDTAWEISFVDLSDRCIEDIKLIYEIEQNRFEDNEIFKENEHACELVLLKENDTKYRVYLRIHHIFWDAYSAEIFEKSVKNNLEFPDLKSDTIPSYSEYAKLVNSTEEVNHRIFSIKSFEEVSNQYKTGFVKNNSKVFSSIIVKPKFRKELPLIDNLWGVIGRTILSYGKQFNINKDWPSKMPAFILFKGRCGKLEKFSNTLGMFLELIPVIVKNGSLSELDNSLRCQVEEYKNSRNITSLDFINFISSNDYKQEDEFEYDHVPVVNFLGIYEFLEGNEFFSSIKLKQLKKGTSNNSLIISIKEETVQVGIYASEEKALTLKSDIEGEV